MGDPSSGEAIARDGYRKTALALRQQIAQAFRDFGEPVPTNLATYRTDIIDEFNNTVDAVELIKSTAASNAAPNLGPQ